MTEEDLQWTPHGRRRMGRPEQSWKNKVMEVMRRRSMEEVMAEDFGLGGLRVTCSPRDPRFAGSNPAEVDEFLWT